ncbi:hypothetical protein [Devosia sp.]|uniref:hypothetical protein n=1 Tax=Devosia sp. TaxID=1871048 RepID=UPI003BAC7448
MAESTGNTPERPLWQQVIRAVARFVVTVAVVFYTLLDELLFPLFRPAIRWLGELQLFQALGRLIQRLPPYALLVLLAVPFIVIEPAKVFALYWGAVGHPFQCLILLIIAQIVSILTCDRIFHVGYEPLMRIGWFKRLMSWVIGLRDKALGWAKATEVWKASVAMIRSVRTWFQGVLASLR